MSVMVQLDLHLSIQAACWAPNIQDLWDNPWTEVCGVFAGDYSQYFSVKVYDPLFFTDSWIELSQVAYREDAYVQVHT